MTEPSQYFKGRTVQEQMNEVISYVDVRAEEVAAAKADDVLEPAEQAKDAAQAAQAAAEDAQDAAEAARDTTLAALPAVNTRIDGVVSDLDAVTLRVTTAEGNIVTIQGRITAVETKNNQQDSAIAALQTADAQNVKIANINQYAVGLTGNQGPIAGVKNFGRIIVGASGSATLKPLEIKNEVFPSATENPAQNSNTFLSYSASNGDTLGSIRFRADTSGNRQIWVDLTAVDGTSKSIVLMQVDASGNVTRGWDS